METNVKINIEVRDASKLSLKKHRDIRECLLDLPSVNPSDLNAFDEKRNKIYKVELSPVKNTVAVYDDGTMVPETGVSGLNQVGVKSILVKSIAAIELGGEQIARINGTVDMPLRGSMKRTSMENAYFTDQETANAVCLAVAELEYEKAQKMKEEVDGAVRVLSQICEVYSKSDSRPVSSFSSRKGKKNESCDADDIANILEDAADAIRQDAE